MTQVITPKNLYETDYLLWAEETVAKLRARDFEHLDLENLIEEIEGLASRDRRELKSRLRTLLEHLLKRLYVNMPQEFNGWQRTIREQRSQIEDMLEQSPSLKSIWAQAFDATWRSALKNVREDYPQTQFPDTWQFERDIDTFLNASFWER
jgi:hypothetical protein